MYPTLRQARLHLDALWWTAGAETSEREIYLRACCVRSSRLPSLPQASRSYTPVAPSCLNSLTPDAHRAGPLHPSVGSAEVARCPSLYSKLRTSPLDTGLEQGYPCSIQLLDAPGKVSFLHTARPIKKARTSLALFLSRTDHERVALRAPQYKGT